MTRFALTILLSTSILLCGCAPQSLRQPAGSAATSAPAGHPVLDELRIVRVERTDTFLPRSASGLVRYKPGKSSDVFLVVRANLDPQALAAQPNADRSWLRRNTPLLVTPSMRKARKPIVTSPKLENDRMEIDYAYQVPIASDRYLLRLGRRSVPLDRYLDRTTDRPESIAIGQGPEPGDAASLAAVPSPAAAPSPTPARQGAKLVPAPVVLQASEPTDEPTLIAAPNPRPNPSTASTADAANPSSQPRQNWMIATQALFKLCARSWAPSSQGGSGIAMQCRPVNCVQGERQHEVGVVFDSLAGCQERCQAIEQKGQSEAGLVPSCLD